MNDYIPFMDKHPELMLVPTTKVKIGISHFQTKYDYVQDLNRKGKNGKKELFHLVIKDEKYGVLLYSPSFFKKTAKIVLPAEYDSIEFLYKIKNSFGAIVQKDGKFGLFFWKYGALKNKTYIIPADYDFMKKIENGRIKGIKDNNVTYFDETGHVLK